MKTEEWIHSQIKRMKSQLEWHKQEVEEGRQIENNLHNMSIIKGKIDAFTEVLATNTEVK